MPSFCAVSNCELKYSHSENVSFHKFPTNNPALLKEWIRFTDRGPDWSPSRWSSICSRHFVSNDFRDYLSRKCLKKSAIPTVIIKNNVSYETYHISSNSSIHEGESNGNFIVRTESAGCGLDLVNDGVAVNGHCDDNRLMYDKTNELMLYCRLCGEHIEQNAPSVPLHNIYDNDIVILLRKCLPTVSICQDPDQTNLVCLECDSYLKQYGEFVDRVIAHQRDVSPSVNDFSEPLACCSASEPKISRPTSITSTMFIKQEPVNVKQEVSEIANKKPVEAPALTRNQQCKMTDSQFQAIESSDHLTQEEEQEIQWSGEQTNAFCGLCGKFLADTHELETHTCDAGSTAQPANIVKNTNCEIMEIVALNNSVSFIDLAEDDYLPVDRILKVENDMDRRERVNIEHAYAKRGQAELQPACLKQEIEMNYDSSSSLEEPPIKNVLCKNAPLTYPSINQLASPINNTLSNRSETSFESAAPNNIEIPAKENNFTCTKWKKKLSNVVILQKQLIKMQALSNKTCGICSAEFKSMHDYLIHKHKMHAQGHQCYQCKRQFSSRHALKYHERNNCVIDAKDFYYSCEHCNEITRNLLKMMDHIKRCPVNKVDCQKTVQESAKAPTDADTEKLRNKVTANCKKFFCEVCGRIFSQRYSLRRHKESHCLQNQNNLKCPNCSMNFSKPFDLTQHIGESACSPKNTIEISTIPIAAINTNDNHAVLAKGSNEHQSMALSSTGLQSTANNKKKKSKYTCELCSKPFRTHASLKQHKFTHLDEKKFICNLCPKTFKRVSGLNQHVRGFHFKIKPYVCPVCNYSYALKGDMLRCRHSKMKKL